MWASFSIFDIPETVVLAVDDSEFLLCVRQFNYGVGLLARRTHGVLHRPEKTIKKQPLK